MVFDGASLPLKAETNQNRSLSRNLAKTRAWELKSLGQDSEAGKLFAKSLEVTSEMVQALITELRGLKIECIVAPFEADAQLAFLCKTGYVDAVLSEDSDLVVFGCPTIIYKTQNDWSCQVFKLDDLKRHPKKAFSQWTHDQFILMCILAGCDYLKNCRNVGLHKGYQIVNAASDLKMIIKKLKTMTDNFDPAYEKGFYRAFYTFKHYKVFCPIRRRIVNLNQIHDESEIIDLLNDLDFLGTGDLEFEVVNRNHQHSFKRKYIGEDTPVKKMIPPEPEPKMNVYEFVPRTESKYFAVPSLKKETRFRKINLSAILKSP